MKTVEHLTKLDAARRQINTAVRMFFMNEDPVAIHAVAAGGMQILSDLGKKKGLQLGIESTIKHIKPERHEEWRKKMREPQNHIKHADKPGDDTKMLEFRPEGEEMFLFLATSAYQEYTDTDTPEVRAMLHWISMRHPHILYESEQKTNVTNLINTYGKITELDRPRFLQFVQWMREDQPVPDIDYR